MKTIKLIWIFLFASSLGFSQVPEGFAKMDDINQFQIAVKKTIGSIQTLKADFSQAKHLSIFSKTLDSDGTLIFKAPGQLKWSYKNPYHYEIIINGKTISINDEGKINSFDLSSSEKFSEINDLILNSITGKILDDERFKTSYFQNKQFQLVVLEPKSPEMSSFISEIHIFIDPDKNQVSKIKLVESANDFTVIHFSNQILNELIADRIFNTP